jgi:hypothetical protein
VSFSGLLKLLRGRRYISGVVERRDSTSEAVIHHAVEKGNSFYEIQDDKIEILTINPAAISTILT